MPPQNCVTCYGWTEEPLSFVLEYCERGELRMILDDREAYPEIPRATSVKLAWGAAKGLRYLHDRGMLHRDIKSLNIFVTRAFEAKLGDFGLSEIKRGIGATQAATTLANTPAWTCPEFSPKLYNTKCDVYSFGVVLWEIGTRLFPFKGKDPIEVLKEVV